MLEHKEDYKFIVVVTADDKDKLLNLGFELFQYESSGKYGAYPVWVFYNKAGCSIDELDNSIDYIPTNVLCF